MSEEIKNELPHDVKEADAANKSTPEIKVSVIIPVPPECDTGGYEAAEGQGSRGRCL